VRRARAVQWLSNALLRVTVESCPSTIGLITLDPKQTGERSAGNPRATFDEAGNGNPLTVRLVRHSQRKRRDPDRPHLRSRAPFLDPTLRGERGDVGIIRSSVRALFLPGRTQDPWRAPDARLGCLGANDLPLDPAGAWRSRAGQGVACVSAQPPNFRPTQRWLWNAEQWICTCS
jgi:hypothetical protein